MLLAVKKKSQHPLLHPHPSKRLLLQPTPLLVPLLTPPKLPTLLLMPPMLLVTPLQRLAMLLQRLVMLLPLPATLPRRQATQCPVLPLTLATLPRPPLTQQQLLLPVLLPSKLHWPGLPGL